MRWGILALCIAMLTVTIIGSSSAQFTIRTDIDPVSPLVSDNVTFNTSLTGFENVTSVNISFSGPDGDSGPFDMIIVGSYVNDEDATNNYTYSAGSFSEGTTDVTLKANYDVGSGNDTQLRNITQTFSFPVVSEPTITFTVLPRYPTDDDRIFVNLSILGVPDIQYVRVRYTQDNETYEAFNASDIWGPYKRFAELEGLEAGDVYLRYTIKYIDDGEQSIVEHYDFRVFDAPKIKGQGDKEGQITVDEVQLMILMGLVIFVGFVGSYIFDRFSVPEVLSLIVLGILIGSVFQILNDDLMNLLRDISPLFAAIALTIILFDGGINLGLDKVIKESSHASILAIVGFVTTMIALGAVAAVLFFEMDLMVGMMLGAALGGTSGAIVIPTVMKVDTSEEVKVLLSLESTITDVLCIVAAVAIAEILVPTSGSTGASGTLGSIIGAFAIGIFLGGMFGILWLRMMPKIEKMSYGFMLTIAFVFVVYAITQFTGGSGPVAALSVGLVLANGPEIGRMFRYKETARMSKSMKQFHSEITFFVKSFFFVYVGLLFTIPEPMIVLYGVLLAAIILAVRAASVNLTMGGLERKDRELMMILGPRGLSAAVLATLPLTYGFKEEGILNSSQIELFTNISLIVILATVIVTTIGIPYGKKRWTDENMAKVEEKRAKKKARKDKEKAIKTLEKDAEKSDSLDEELEAKRKALEEEEALKKKELEDEIAEKKKAIEEEVKEKKKAIEEEKAEVEKVIEESKSDDDEMVVESDIKVKKPAPKKKRKKKVAKKVVKKKKEE